METVSIDEVMKLKPCYTRNKILSMTGGKDKMTLLEIAQCESISVKCRMWVFFQLLPKKTIGQLACDFAEHTLPIYGARYPDDKRLHAAIEIQRAYLAGKATEEERTVARDAMDAARGSWRVCNSWAVANAVVHAVENVNIATVARSARSARGAAKFARDAELKWQLEKILEYLEGSR